MMRVISLPHRFALGWSVPHKTIITSCSVSNQLVHSQYHLWLAYFDNYFDYINGLCAAPAPNVLVSVYSSNSSAQSGREMIDGDVRTM